MENVFFVLFVIVTPILVLISWACDFLIKRKDKIQKVPTESTNITNTVVLHPEPKATSSSQVVGRPEASNTAIITTPPTAIALRPESKVTSSLQAVGRFSASDIDLWSNRVRNVFSSRTLESTIKGGAFTITYRVHLQQQTPLEILLGPGLLDKKDYLRETLELFEAIVSEHDTLANYGILNLTDENGIQMQDLKYGSVLQKINIH